MLKEKIINNLEIDLENFISPPEYIQDYELPNLREGIELFLKHMENNSSVGIVVDSDNDGYGSSAILGRYMKKVFNIEPKFIFHLKKTHGLKSIVEDQYEVLDDINLLILPDGGTNDVKLHNKILEEKNVECLVIDHHYITEDLSKSKAVVINNSGLSKTCGGTTVYLFLKAIDEELWEDQAEEYLGLNAFTLIADSMPSSDHEVNHYVRLGLKNMKNGLIKYMLEKENIYENISPKDLIFKVNSFFNSIIRVGSQEDKELLIKALCAEEDIPKYNEYRGKWQSLYHRCYLTSKNCKNKQKKIIDKADYNLEISPNNLFAIIKIENEDTLQIMGLLANKFMKSLNMPVMVVNSKTMRGSLRANYDFRDILNSSGLVTAMGHLKACGVHIKEEFTMEGLEKYILEECEIKEEEKKEYISANINNITGEDVYELAMINNQLYGGVPEIEFCINELDLEKEYTNESGSLTKYNYLEFSVVCFDRNLIEEIWEGSSIVVSPSVNNFRGREEIQLIIRKIL